MVTHHFLLKFKNSVRSTDFTDFHAAINVVSVTPKVLMLNKTILCYICGNLWTTAFSSLKTQAAGFPGHAAKLRMARHV
ncbi:MAG TPA: hypothetical protein PLU16_12395 [Gallionellaceae bacterium]|jgi:hypothetical protein|nr:hypothetical protein [Gallionellaceae bacterium]HQS76007.1 hypothetical protein [Gallionellaceae bacterium]